MIIEILDLTILITTYNAEDRILKLLSFLDSFKIKVNVLIADDCSKDNTIDMIEKSINNETFKFLIIDIKQNEKNLGLGKNREINIKYIKTSFFIFCDDDDILNLDVLAKTYKKWKKNNISIFKMICINKMDDIKSKSFYDFDITFMNCKSKKHYFENSYWFMVATIFNTNFYKKNPIVFLDKQDLGEDINSWQLLANYKFSIIWTLKPLYIYIKRQNSLSHLIDMDKVIENTITESVR